MTKAQLIVVRVLAALMVLVCFFFIFYTARLLWVTHGLTSIRAGGKGAYIGAVAFPLLAALFGYGARRLMKMTQQSELGNTDTRPR